MLKYWHPRMTIIASPALSCARRVTKDNSLRRLLVSFAVCMAGRRERERNVSDWISNTDSETREWNIACDDACNGRNGVVGRDDGRSFAERRTRSTCHGDESILSPGIETTELHPSMV